MPWYFFHPSVRFVTSPAFSIGGKFLLLSQKRGRLFFVTNKQNKWLWMMLFDCRLVLTVRDPTAWYRSVATTLLPLVGQIDRLVFGGGSFGWSFDEELLPFFLHQFFFGWSIIVVTQLLLFTNHQSPSIFHLHYHHLHHQVELSAEVHVLGSLPEHLPDQTPWHPLQVALHPILLQFWGEILRGDSNIPDFHNSKSVLW